MTLFHLIITVSLLGPVEQTFINSAYTQIIWAWKATQGMPTFNTDGSITTIVNANQAAGFSFLKWKGTVQASNFGTWLIKCARTYNIKKPN